MTRSKSPFRSFRFKKSKSPPEASSGNYSDDEEHLRGLESTDEELEGMLVRKHEWESTTKKASNRSWDRICVVLKGSQVLFYKDQKTYRTRPEETFRSELPVDLIGGTAEVAADYTKKKHVFRLRLANGGDYLFQAQDDEQMNLWVNSINQQAQVHEEGPGKSQTLPPGSEKKDEPKRRSFFTLKKN
jgi:spectrin beta